MYKEMVEGSVNASAYQWLSAYKKKIDKEFQMDLDLRYLEQQFTMDQDQMYRSCSNYESLYKYTIRNVVFRNDDAFIDFEAKVLNVYANIAIMIDNSANFLIKSNGEYTGDTIEAFISMIGAYAGRFDRYTVNVNVNNNIPYRDDLKVAQVVFTMSNRMSYPMVFEVNN
jgi:hypothetical protein